MTAGQAEWARQYQAQATARGKLAKAEARVLKAALAWEAGEGDPAVIGVQLQQAVRAYRKGLAGKDKPPSGSGARRGQAVSRGSGKGSKNREVT